MNPAVKTILSNKNTPLYQIPLPTHLTYIRMHQCHSNNVRIATTTPTHQYIDNCDAIITSERNYLLLAKTADCLPILIYKPPHTIAAIHAGRQGTLNEITSHTIQKIHQLSPEKTKWAFWFGPHICAHCYEVGPLDHRTYSLQAENIQQIRHHLPDDHFTLIQSKHCTLCHHHLYFSYRKNHYQSGRFFSGIYLL